MPHLVENVNKRHGPDIYSQKLNTCNSLSHPTFKINGALEYISAKNLMSAVMWRLFE